MLAAILPDRSVVKIAGDDARKFLNGLLTADIGKVKWITGKIVSEATNNNFNEMRLQSEDGSTTWIISLDREVGQRNPDWRAGDKLQITGPVLNSFGLKIIVMSYGQVEKIN